MNSNSVLFSPGWRSSLRQRDVLLVFIAGLILGGILTASVLWALSGLAAPIEPDVRHIALIVIAGAGALREAKLLHIPLPQNARQIPQDVLQIRPRLGAMQFGFELGTGVRTYVSSSAPYVLALGLVLSHLHVGTAVAVGAAFGLGRALSAAMQYWSRHPSWNAHVATRLPWITNTPPISILAAMVVAAT